MTACGIVVGIAAAGGRARADATADAWRARWGTDGPLVGKTFHFDHAKDDVAAELASKSPISCVDLDVSESDAVLDEPVSACTATIATSDRDACRMAAVTAIMVYRQGRLLVGDDRSFSFALRCEGFVVRGTWNRYGAGIVNGNGNVRLRTENPDGDVLDADTVTLTWARLPPDPDRPAQWMSAVLVPAAEAQAALERLQRVLAAGGIDDVDYVSGNFTLELDYRLQELKDFPARDGDDAVRRAAIAWLTAEQAALDHGDLRTLLERAAVAHPKASDQRKTKAIAARYRKAAARRLRALELAIDRFTQAHDLD